MSARYVCVHGHFYQPPRENPWLGAIETQDSAYPFHDWNERITAECYAPNAVSRLLDSEGWIERLVNNYSRMSFNFGPTLLSWLARSDPRTYAAILEADVTSRREHDGHGAALAQAWGHTILPLASPRDRRLQVLWGLADFEFRFGRRAVGMWLPETAVDLATLEILAEHEVRFTILAPHQAARVRSRHGGEWREVDETVLETGLPYEALLPSGRTIALFFYDPEISRAIAFGRLLDSGAALAERLLALCRRGAEPRLGHVATDGETYGHHHRFGEMALTWALDRIEREPGVRLTNYSEFLERHPPTLNVELHEPSSWSCVHGIERWRTDCGCAGGRPGWHQAWRAPLRLALDDLRESLGRLFFERGRSLFGDPWIAREDYVHVLLDPTDGVRNAFFDRHAPGVGGDDRVLAWTLLEMERHAQMMFTSCGWFFEEISGIESVQVLLHAARAMQLARDAGAADPEPEFVTRLAAAPSNRPEFVDGRGVWQRLVQPAISNTARAGAHWATNRLFEPERSSEQFYDWKAESLEHLVSPPDQTRAFFARVRLTETATESSSTLFVGAVHLGDHHLATAAVDDVGPERFRAATAEIAEALATNDLTEVVRRFDRLFDGRIHSLNSLFRDDQRRLAGILLEPSVAEASEALGRLHERNAPLLRLLGNLGAPPPLALRVASEYALDARMRQAIASGPSGIERLATLTTEADAGGIPIDRAGLGLAVGRALERSAATLEARGADPESIRLLARAIVIARALPLEISFWAVENRIHAHLSTLDPADPDSARRAAWEALASALRLRTRE